MSCKKYNMYYVYINVSYLYNIVYISFFFFEKHITVKKAVRTTLYRYS